MKFAIIGTGIMGRGWITQCAMTGHEAHCYDDNKEILAGTIDEAPDTLIARIGSLSAPCLEVAFQAVQKTAWQFDQPVPVWFIWFLFILFQGMPLSGPAGDIFNKFKP